MRASHFSPAFHAHASSPVSLPNQRIVPLTITPRPAGPAAAGSIKLTQSHIIHHPRSSTGLMLINLSSIRLTSSGSTSLDGWERIQWSISYILSQAVQVRIRCLLYMNFRAMYSPSQKKMQLSLSKKNNFKFEQIYIKNY